MSLLRKLPALALLAAAFALVGCPPGPRTSDADLRRLSYQALQDLLATSTTKAPVVLIDIRTAEQYDAGHIPGAINIADVDLRRSTHPQLMQAAAIIVYAQDQEGDYADPAAKTLLARGFENVYSFPGGMTRWLEMQGRNDEDAKK